MKAATLWGNAARHARRSGREVKSNWKTAPRVEGSAAKRSEIRAGVALHRAESIVVNKLAVTF